MVTACMYAINMYDQRPCVRIRDIKPKFGWRIYFLAMAKYAQSPLKPCSCRNGEQLFARVYGKLQNVLRNHIQLCRDGFPK